MLSSHFKLKERLEYPIELTVESPLHIGDSSLNSIDTRISNSIKFNQDGENIPYIPGSSLKGIFRSHIEQILRSSKKYYACNPFKDPCKEGIELRESSSDAGMCLSCFLFGNQNFKGEVIISDFMPKEVVDLKYKTSTAITRDNGTAKGRSLHSIEYIVPQSKFNGTINVNNPILLVQGYLAMAIRDINRKLIKLGAFTSKGFGEIKLNATQYTTWVAGQVNPRVTQISSFRNYLKQVIRKMEEKL